MKKNLTIMVSILLLSLLTFSNCRKESANSTASKTTDISNVSSQSPDPNLTETQILIRKWIEWVFARDVNDVPWDDPTGAKQYAGQPYSNGTMMLAGGGSEDLVNREITIDLNQYQYVFIPLVNVFGYWNDCYSGHPDNGNVPDGTFISLFTEAVNGKRNLVFNWDGNSLLTGKLNDFRAKSGVWEDSIDPSWDNGCVASATTFYADGFWAKIALTPGVHQLEVGGDADFKRFKFGFSNHVIYTITVTD